MYKESKKQIRQRFILPVLLLWLVACTSSQDKLQQGHPASYYYLQGLKHINSTQNQRAENDFKRALELDPEYAPAHEGLGRILLEEGRLHEAALHIDRALELDKAWMPALMLKGRLYLLRGDYNISIAVLKDIIKRVKDLEALEDKKKLTASALYWIGVAHFEQKGWQKAENIFSELLRINPDDEHAKKMLREASYYAQLIQGKSERVKQMVLQKTIKRGELALLIYEILVPTLGMANDSSGVVAKDIAPAEPLYNVLKELSTLGLMLPYPDSTFKPQTIAERGDLVLVLGRVLDRTEPHTIDTNRVDFLDVPHIFPFYSYVNRIVTLNIMSSVDEQHFVPRRPLSGLEALEAIEKTKAILKSARDE
ncbi:MAG TPA: tetratricopeptide repeat protein [Calditrichaeota bacterium]|nr:tetratricopeptide repeat protein [Calditrichota bacterium]